MDCERITTDLLVEGCQSAGCSFAQEGDDGFVKCAKFDLEGLRQRLGLQGKGCADAGIKTEKGVIDALYLEGRLIPVMSRKTA